MTPDNSVILVPSYRYIEPETEESLRALEGLGWDVVRRHGMSHIDLARSIMASEAYFRGVEWLFWIDGDMLFTVADFLKLANWNEQFCCAPYAQKASGGVAAYSNKPGIRGNSNNIDYAGFGFMKTHRQIYERMQLELPMLHRFGKPLVPFFQSGIFDSQMWGEDYHFCHRAMKLGFQLKADFTIRLGHIGRWAFTLDNPL